MQKRMLDDKKEVDFLVISETLFCTSWGVVKPFKAKGSQVYSTQEAHIPRVRCEHRADYLLAISIHPYNTPQISPSSGFHS